MARHSEAVSVPSTLDFGLAVVLRKESHSLVSLLHPWCSTSLPGLNAWNMPLYVLSCYQRGQGQAAIHKSCVKFECWTPNIFILGRCYGGRYGHYFNYA